MNYPDDGPPIEKLFPHEFLFLLCNARNRLELINKIPKANFSIDKDNIKKYEMQPLDARRLDQIFKLDVN